MACVSLGREFLTNFGLVQSEYLESSKRVFRNIERSLAGVVHLLRTASPGKGFLASVFWSRNWRQLYALFRIFKARHNTEARGLGGSRSWAIREDLPALRFRASGVPLCARDALLQASISCSCGCSSRNAAPQHDKKAQELCGWSLFQPLFQCSSGPDSTHVSIRNDGKTHLTAPI